MGQVQEVTARLTQASIYLKQQIACLKPINDKGRLKLALMNEHYQSEGAVAHPDLARICQLLLDVPTEVDNGRIAFWCKQRRLNLTIFQHYWNKVEGENGDLMLDPAAFYHSEEECQGLFANG